MPHLPTLEVFRSVGVLRQKSLKGGHKRFVHLGAKPK